MLEMIKCNTFKYIMFVSIKMNAVNIPNICYNWIFIIVVLLPLY